jgi:hypothetical protein
MTKCLNCGHENVEGAGTCAKCGFTLNWKPEPEPEPTPKPKPAPTELVLDLVPTPARVPAGGTVTLSIAGPLPPGLETVVWTPTGDAADLVTGVSAHEVTLRVPEAAAPGQRTLVLLTTGETVAPARAVGRIEIVAPEPGPERDDGRSPLVVALAIAGGLLLLLVLVGVAARLATGSTKVEILAARGVCLHTSPDTKAETRIPLPGGGCEGPNQGEIVEVRCAEDDVLRLARRGRWMTSSSSLVQPEREVRECRAFPLSLLLGASVRTPTAS